jgi:exodeoxyribonuclease V alpha subunit
MSNITSDKLATMLAAARAKKAAQESIIPLAIPSQESTLAQRIAAARAAARAANVAKQQAPLVPFTLVPAITTGIDKYGNSINYNTEQTRAIELMRLRKSFILIGAAGTGKTTTIRGVVELAIREIGIPPLPHSIEHKHLNQGTPAIACVAYTRRAVNNIKRAMPDELATNCITIHKLLEYGPVYSEIIDERGNVRTTMRFEPNRTAYNPLPAEIDILIIDEASMVSIELYELVTNAMAHKMQIIFVGDIQQLPPVFGSAILGYKMLELPTVELTQVYRQALESPIIRLAHRILSGNPIPLAEYPSWCIEGQLTIREWKRSISDEIALMTIAKLLTTYIDAGIYDPDNDAVLIPFNKACGTTELNKHIGNFLARKNGRDTYEIIAGFMKSYYSIGDKVLFDKEDAIITDIKKNPHYLDTKPRHESPTLDYWGHELGTGNSSELSIDAASDEDIDKYLDALANDDSSKPREASHIVTLYMQDSDREVQLSTSGDINSLSLGWALTIHKSQGSEWNKVFLFLHKSHATMIQRELLYTACTRAKQELFVLCESDTFTKGILNQRIVGNTLAEKAEFFKGKSDNASSSYTPSGKER